MPRPCSSCNKLASLEIGEPEIQSDVELSNSSLTAEVRVVKTSACCGEEMKEYTFTLEEDISSALEDHQNAKHTVEVPEGEEEPEVEVNDDDFSVDAGDPEATERSQTHDRHGKPIKSFRYRRSYTGVEVPVTVTCQKCNEVVWDGVLKDETENSSFDEI